MEKEILAAEVCLHSVNTEYATAEIDVELNKVEQALNAYSCSASMSEYAIAVISGLLAGAIDVFVIGETPLVQTAKKPVSEQLIDIGKKIVLNNASNEKIAKPIMHGAVSKGLPALIPGLESHAAQPTPVGLLASVLIQMGQGGLLKEKNNTIQLFPDGIGKDDGIILAVIAVIVGILRWLSVISAEDRNPQDASYSYKTLDKIRELIREVPAFSQIVKEIEKWQKQLPNEMKCEKEAHSSDTGVESVFNSFFLMLGSVPVLQNSNLQKAVHAAQEGKRLGLNEIPIIKSLTRQAFPVMVNEIIVRSFFFAERLAKALQQCDDIAQIDWNPILPFGNRDIDRLLALSSMTLSVADTADAALHAAIDSCGNMTLFAARFVTRFNFIAAGRAAVAVVKEVSNEKVQTELIHMKRLLAEAKTTRALEVLQQYQEQLEQRVSEYLAEDITAFLEGFDWMDRGLSEKDSNLVIKGNVIIQRILGREPQFTNQAEFDSLMDSDMPLIL